MSATHELRVYLKAWAHKHLVGQSPDPTALIEALSIMGPVAGALMGELAQADAATEAGALMAASERVEQYQSDLLETAQHYIRQFPRSER